MRYTDYYTGSFENGVPLDYGQFIADSFLGLAAKLFPGAELPEPIASKIPDEQNCMIIYNPFDEVIFDDGTSATNCLIIDRERVHRALAGINLQSTWGIEPLYARLWEITFRQLRHYV